LVARNNDVRVLGAGMAIMTRYVVGPDVVLRLAKQGARVRPGIKLLAPTLMRSELLNLLFQLVRTRKLSKPEADKHLDYVRRLRIRLLGDRVLQAKAWQLADELGWPDTFEPEYIALTQLQAEALVTTNSKLASAAKRFVAVAPLTVLM
jgi:predicted nucleic acid-binding protein